VREIVERLAALTAEEAAVLRGSESDFAEAVRKAEREFEAQRDQAAKEARRALAQAQRAHDEGLAILNMAYNTSTADARARYQAERSRLLVETKEREERALKKHKESLWLIDSDAEAATDDLCKQMAGAKEMLKRKAAELDGVANAAVELGDRFLPEGWQNGAGLSAESAQQTPEPQVQVAGGAKLLAAAQQSQHRKILEFPVAIVVAVTAVACIGGTLLVYTLWHPPVWVTLLPWILVPVVAGIYGKLRTAAARAMKAACIGVLQRVADEKAEAAERAAQAIKAAEAGVKDVSAKRERETTKARSDHEPRFAKLQSDHQARIAECDASYAQASGQRDAERDRAATAIRERLANTTETHERETRQRLADLQGTLDRLHSAATLGREGAREALREAWRTMRTRLGELISLTTIQDAADAPLSEDVAWHSPGGTWAPRSAERGEPDGMRLGWFSTKPLLAAPAPEQAEVRGSVQLPDRLPACVAFPRQGSVIIDFDPAGRERALMLMKSLVFRLVSSLPAGRAKFLFIDPRGLGHTFAGFMHLADYDETLVTGRIWAESKHVQDRLTDVSDQIQSVIQRCLRNEFASIEAYNRSAGEIAEPYRFNVIADFPAAFDEVTARRLVAIMTSGQRCGVHAVLGVDISQPLPPGVSLAELRQHGASISVRGEQIVWNDPALDGLHFEMETPAHERTITQVAQRIGQAAREAGTVRVPFDAIAPAKGKEWSRSSAAGLAIPIGRSGATRLQELTLGQGTRHHVLIAGKTGSGKSTLLHVLVTSAAAWYSPDELEIDLIDFKKGVEFKAYAKERLPHARTIAIESDREFGLSILQRLDQEMRRRGDIFREAGAQDIAAYRALAGERERMPRSLLIIDEFQELFSEDDRLAQDAASLLDRLVRQGRAFGMHAILSTQTLAGAYGLARSTVSQIAVRIALACGEADAHLILSEDNDAARLLVRPGDAIYNDAGGLVEGNSRFQVCWLSDARRDQAVQDARERAGVRWPMRPFETTVFEGQEAPTLAECRPLQAAASSLRRPAGAGGRVRAWLGEPVAIGETTHVDWVRGPRAGLLIVGHREEAGRSMIASAAASMAAQCEEAARFVVIDDGAGADFWREMGSGLPALEVTSVDGAGAAAALRDAAAEVKRRFETGAATGSTVLVAVVGVERFRNLWAREDEFGMSFSSNESETVQAERPDRDLAAILKDGPAVGVHPVIWSSGLSSLTRALGSKGVGEFAYRVAFQMSAGDSSALIDSPLAGRLTQHRALLYRDDLGTVEKLRPFGLLSASTYRDLLVTSAEASAPAIQPV